MSISLGSGDFAVDVNDTSETVVKYRYDDKTRRVILSFI